MFGSFAFSFIVAVAATVFDVVSLEQTHGANVAVISFLHWENNRTYLCCLCNGDGGGGDRSNVIYRLTYIRYSGA